jgi:hypothetical protein
MDTQYVKTTVGPVLAEALASLLLHYPPTPQKPEDTMVDPIAYIGRYLLHHAESNKQIQSWTDRKVQTDAIVSKWKEVQQREKLSRAKLGEEVFARVSVRRSQIEKEEEVVPPVVEPVVDVPPPVLEAPEPASTV